LGSGGFGKNGVAEAARGAERAVSASENHPNGGTIEITSFPEIKRKTGFFEVARCLLPLRVFSILDFGRQRNFPFHFLQWAFLPVGYFGVLLEN
jgi:hypothetical protein